MNQQTKSENSFHTAAARPGKVVRIPSPPPFAAHPKRIGARWWDGPYVYDPMAAARAVGFIECLPQVKGEWAGWSLHLQKWERHIIQAVFGWKRADGSRRYRYVYIEIPRKNGKSTLASGVAALLLCADDEAGAEIYSAAAERKQAGIVFDTARQMIRGNQSLRSMVDSFRSSIYYRETASSYQVLSADADTKHGFNAHGVIFDELHAQPNRKLWDVLRTSMGSRRQPLLMAITTAGYDRHSICYQVHEHAIRVRDGILEDDAFLPVIYAADPEDDWTAPATWRKANPNLGVSLKLDYIREECKRAQADPEIENTFKRLHLNLWTEQAVRYLPMVAWDKCATPVNVSELEGQICYAGLDLSSTEDISALVLLFPPSSPDEPFRILPFFWIPKENMLKRADRDRVPYPAWCARRFIEATEGNVIDYEYIRRRMNELGQKYGIQEIAFDPWNATQLTVQLESDGFRCVPFRQGFGSMNEPTKHLKSLVMSQQIAHGGNPVLRWMASNVAVRTDPAGNVKPDKEKSADRIDGIVGMVMALGAAMINTPSVYNSRGILSI